MEILPKNVINKIFLFLQHPIAEMLKVEGIFVYMQMRFTPHLRYKGSAYDCAEADTCSTRRNNPRKYKLVNGRRMHTRELSPEEDSIYLIVYNHATPFIHREIDLVTEWNIKGRGWTQPYTFSSDYSETDRDPDSDTDSDQGWGVY
jgi:hypothetical protein